MLAELGLFEVATMRFGFVGSTFMKLSAWLPLVALALITGSRQVNGLNSSKCWGARSGGFMHLRVPSGTAGCLVVTDTCACNIVSEGVRKTKMAARIVRWRRVFMSVCVLLMRW